MMSSTLTVLPFITHLILHPSGVKQVVIGSADVPLRMQLQINPSSSLWRKTICTD
jgi:hypothetical protein